MCVCVYVCMCCVCVCVRAFALTECHVVHGIGQHKLRYLRRVPDRHHFQSGIYVPSKDHCLLLALCPHPLFISFSRSTGCNSFIFRVSVRLKQGLVHVQRRVHRRWRVCCRSRPALHRLSGGKVHADAGFAQLSNMRCGQIFNYHRLGDQRRLQQLPCGKV